MRLTKEGCTALVIVAISTVLVVYTIVWAANVKLPRPDNSTPYEQTMNGRFQGVLD